MLQEGWDMLKIMQFCLACIINGLFVTTTVFAAASHDSPLGLWKTHDDQGKLTGYVRITEDKGVYTGVIEKGLETDKEDKYCTACKDARKDQKLVGMTMMKNVKAKGDAYEGTEILDPFSGNTYRVKLTLKEAGNIMEVRGFVGFSLFGRTQIWHRAE
jgi:uncharacterized protein (DUF2147 family)